MKKSAELLPARWEEEAFDWGRVTAGTALALAGYVANYYASPVFNRTDDQSRWQEAYELNKQALEKLQQGHFGLSYEGNPGENASNWAKIWTNVYCGESQNSEAVYIATRNCSSSTVTRASTVRLLSRVQSGSSSVLSIVLW